MTETPHTPRDADAPAGGWVCFHCGEAFFTKARALDHFGGFPTATAKCIVDGGGGVQIVMEGRRAWREVIRLDFRIADLEAENKRLRAVIRGLLAHSGIADMDPADKDPEELEAESRALDALDNGEQS